MSRLDGRWAQVECDGRGQPVGFVPAGTRTVLPVLGIRRHWQETLWSLPALHTGHGDTKQIHRQREVDGQTTAAMEVPPLLPRGLASFTRSERFGRQ